MSLVTSGHAPHLKRKLLLGCLHVDLESHSPTQVRGARWGTEAASACTALIAWLHESP
jgi:hypothetical protein